MVWIKYLRSFSFSVTLLLSVGDSHGGEEISALDFWRNQWKTL